jgi:hypothetical protein
VTEFVWNIFFYHIESSDENEEGEDDEDDAASLVAPTPVTTVSVSSRGDQSLESNMSASLSLHENED